MNLQQLELDIIQCLSDNIKSSGESVPVITRNTAPQSDIEGFDSLRTLEVLIELEEKLGCELPPEKVFPNPYHSEQTVEDLAKAIFKIVKG
jgi:acyl carrier protein